MIPQKFNNKVTEDLVGSEGRWIPGVDLRRMMIKMFNKLKELLKTNSMNIKRTLWINQLNEYQENNKWILRRHTNN
jgi:hypothetical protein